jgi:hypothetical protein
MDTIKITPKPLSIALLQRIKILDSEKASRNGLYKSQIGIEKVISDSSTSQEVK